MPFTPPSPDTLEEQPKFVPPPVESLERLPQQRDFSVYSDNPQNDLTELARARGEDGSIAPELPQSDFNLRPAFVPQVVGRFMQSAASPVAGALESIGIAATKLSNKFGDPLLEGSAGDYKVEDRPTYKLGRAIRKKVAEAYPIDETREKSFLVDTLPSAAGSMAGFIAGGAAGKALKASGAASVALLGAGAQGAETFNEAIKSGASDEDAFEVFMINAGLGTTEAIPIAGWLSRLNKASGNRLKRAIIEGSQEAAQEVVQQFGSNLTAQKYYDPDRSWSEGLIEGGGAGFTLGSLASLLVSAIGGRRARTTGATTPTPIPELAQTTTQDLSANEQFSRELNQRGITAVPVTQEPQLNETPPSTETKATAPAGETAQAKAEETGLRAADVGGVEPITVYHATSTEPGLGQKSGYYPGTYSATDVGMVEKFGSKKYQAEIDPSKIYQLTDSEALKTEAADAGFGRHSGNGTAEVEYLKSKGFEGLSRGKEIILFDNAAPKYQLTAPGSTGDVIAGQLPFGEAQKLVEGKPSVEGVLKLPPKPPNTIPFARQSELRSRPDANLIAIKPTKDGNDYFVKRYTSRKALEVFLKNPGQWRAVVKTEVGKNMVVNPAFEVEKPGVRTQESISAVVDTIAGKMDLTEFEKKGYAPEQVTQQNWIDLQRAERRRLGQSEESGTANAPFQDYKSFHEDAVRRALEKGEDIDAEVLTDYPDLKPIVSTPQSPQQLAEQTGWRFGGAQKDAQGKELYWNFTQDKAGSSQGASVEVPVGISLKDLQERQKAKVEEFERLQPEPAYSSPEELLARQPAAIPSETVAQMEARAAAYKAKSRQQTGEELNKEYLAQQKTKAPAPVEDTRTPAEILNSAAKIKLTLPAGANMIRVTTRYKDRDIVSQPISKQELEKANTFINTGVVKVEAGSIGQGKKFIPAKGKVEIRDAKVKTEPAANLGTGLPTRQGMTREEATTIAQGEDTAGFKVNVVSKQEAVDLTGAQEAAGYGGFYYNGEIYLVHENMGKGNMEAAKALLREEIGHGLLRTEVGTKLVNEAIAKAKLQLTPKERQILRDKGYQEHQLLDEFIAKSAMENRSWWNDLVARTKRFFEGNGFKATNEEVARALLRRIRREISGDVAEVDGTLAAGEATQPKDQTDTPEFKRWSEGARLIRAGEDLTSVKDGEPVVVEAFHGTTRDFKAFDPSMANVENDFGKAIYTTNNPEDVSANYAGIGPDLTGRIERRAEQLFQDGDYKYGTPAYKKAYAKAKQKATKELTQHGGATMKVFVRLKNPLKLGGENEAYWDYEFNEENQTDSGKAADFIAAMRDVSSRYEDVDENQLMEKLSDLVDGKTASEAIDSAREGVPYATDENGDIATSQIIREAIQRMGYDGVIDATVDTKFGSQRRIGKQMAGMDESTVHVIAFTPEQIKSATGNRGQFDPNNPDISAGEPTPPREPTPKEEDVLKSKSFKANAELADELGIITPQDDESGVPTKVGDVYDMVLSRPGLNAAVREDSVSRAASVLNEAGLKAVASNDGLFRLADEKKSQEAAGQRLVSILEREIQSARAENRPERIANLLNTVVVHLARDKNQAFSQALKNRLYYLAQGERSSFGRALGGLAMWGKVLANVAQNPKLHLDRIYSDAFGGDLVRRIMDRIASNFKESFSGEEIERLYNANPKLRELFDNVVNRLKAKPTLKQVIDEIFATPIYRQDDLVNRFVDTMVNKFSATPDEAAKLKAEFSRTFQQSFAAARTKAQEKALKSLTPQEAKVIGKGTPLWKKITNLVNAGGFDSGEILAAVAKEHGWTVPTESELSQMREWSAREQRLREPSQRQIEKFKGDVAKATKEAETGTEQERIALIKKIQSNWSRWSMPVKWLSLDSVISKNRAKAINEFVGANLLLKFGFAVRQMMDVGIVSMPLNAVNRSLVHIVERAQTEGGFSPAVLKDLDAATREAVTARIASVKATLRQMERTLTGHTSRRVLDRMTHSIGIFERMAAKADALEAKGNIAGARAVRLATLLQAGYRIAATWDSIQSVGLEWQEMRQQLSTDLRVAGKTHAEITTQLDDVFGGLKVDMLEALKEAETIGLERGLTKDKATLQNDAWNLIKTKAYDRMREATGGKRDYQAENEQLRELHSWNLPETGGIGGLLAETIKTIRSKTEKAGVPTGGLFSFGNAIGIAANRMATFSGGGLLGGWGFGDSPWYQGERNIRQRRIEAVEGMAVIGLLVALAAAGKIIVQAKYPADKDEKEKFIAEGHKLNTIRFVNDDGSWIETPIQMSPFSFIAPPVYMIGGIQQLLTDKARAQAKLDTEAARTGAVAGKVKGVSAGDVASVLAQGGYGFLTGGRTAGGAIQSFSDYGNFNLNKSASAFVTPYIPALPAWQETARMMGAAMDTRTATMAELLVPSPWSGHQRVNSLGDPLTNPDAVKRVLQVLTGGYSYGSDKGETASSHAYQQLFQAGYSTPEIPSSKGFNFDGVIRPMTPQELEKYTVTRGKAFKQELEGVNVDGLPQEEAYKVVQQAYQRANSTALGAISATPNMRQGRYVMPSFRTASTTTRPPSFRPVRYNLAPRTRSAFGSRTRKPRRVALGKIKAVKVRKMSMFGKRTRSAFRPRRRGLYA